MTQPRKQLISISDTPYYHVVSRCVRRAFLCGVDQATQNSYEHRRQWIEDRIRILSSLFAIDVCAFSVMSNHYHLVLKLDPIQAEQWTNKHVMQRWTQLHKGPLLIQKRLANQPLTQAEKETTDEIIAVWRQRLTNLSWFMKLINEPIARLANREDECTGHFWESRFKSQALFTQEALLACMAYVDLNPQRAKIAHTPESSKHTSIKERIQPCWNADTAINEQIKQGTLYTFQFSIKALLHFEGTETHQPQTGIPITKQDYLTLVDETGRIARQDKRGYIPNHLPCILDRLNIQPEHWLLHSTQFERYYPSHFRRRPNKAG